MATATEAEHLATLLGDWAGPDTRNLTDRLTLALRHVIEAGVVTPGSLLPPERALAAALAVSRPTVSAAVADLRRLGLVESRQGSGTRVSGCQRNPDRPPFFELAHTSGVINLAGAMAFDASHLGDLSLTTADLLAVSPPDGLDPRGFEDLRAAVASRLADRGRLPPDAEVVVTSGAHQALALAVAAHVEPGGRVLVEEHTYGGLSDLATSGRFGLVGVARDGDGVDPSDLDAKLARYRPDLVVLIANLHSPTGRLTPAQRLDEIAAVLDHHRVRTIADATYDELVYHHQPAGLASRCEAAPIVSVGSLSKAAWSGLRVGWVATDRTEAEHLVRLRTARFDFGLSAPAQILGRRLLERFDEMITARRATLAATADAVSDRLATSLDGWEIHRPDGGLTLWCRLPREDSGPFVAELYDAGVAVLAGASSRVDHRPDPHVRICFDRPAPMLDAGLDRLIDTWRSFRTTMR